MDEISYRFETVNPKSKIQTGMAGIDPKGNYKQRKIPYILSDSHITEILDQVCDNRLKFIFDYLNLIFIPAPSFTRVEVPLLPPSHPPTPLPGHRLTLPHHAP